MAEIFSSLVVDVVSLYCRSALASATLCRSEQQGMDVQGSSPLIRAGRLVVTKFNQNAHFLLGLHDSEKNQNHNFVFRIEITIFSQPFFSRQISIKIIVSNIYV